MPSPSGLLRNLPSIDSLLKHEQAQELARRHSRELVLEEARSLLEGLRRWASRDSPQEDEFAQRLESLPQQLESRIKERLSPLLRRVINASGVILHTNVGRAPISQSLAQSMIEMAGSYSSLEYDLSQGRRGHRDLNFESRAVRLLGCEAATVANNNAAALFLLLNTLARGKEVLVSRGELIEIGGSFRLPAIMESSGARLREVGTTNRTRVSDYRDAIGEDTALILRVHPSNYKIVGFAQAPGLREMAQLSRERGIPLAEDVGSGYLFRTDHDCLRQEPSVSEAVSAGIDLVCFSGDKLLGGPQAGIILGRRDLISRIRKNPLMRACRVDKVTYAGLERTLIEYETGRWQETIPIYRMISTPPEEIRRRAQRLRDSLDSSLYAGQVIEGESLIGGGSAPEERLPTWLLAVQPLTGSASRQERRLRQRDPPILVRVEQDRLLLDLRTVFPRDDEEVAAAFQLDPT